MSAVDSKPLVPNAMRLLIAGFMAILAAGIGFAIRGGILDNWGREFGFNATQLGAIGGAGLTGFCFGIIIGGVVADKIGYGKLVIAAFLFHIISAFVALAANKNMAPETSYQCLFWGSFIFAIANGTLEAVANPLVATIFPNNRTHYLNILHASWPAGLVLGGVAGWVLDDRLEWPWQYQLGLFLIPTAIYGLLFLGQKMPKSEAAESGLTLGQMFKDVGLLGGLVVCYLLAIFFNSIVTPLLTPANATAEQLAAAAKQGMYISYGVGGVLLIGIGLLTRFSLGSFLLFVLFVAHALVGAVELGTDSWIQNITGNLFTSQQGKVLFVYTSMLMFVLRFCAHFIEKKIGLSPVGLLLTCAVLAAVGLNLTSMATTFAFAIVALTVYGIGKTFFWPTMLAVASDRFPRTGAIAISIMGGIGMMSGGLVGSQGLGYFKDRYSGEALQQADAQLYEQYKSAKVSKFPPFPDATGLDGTKLGDATGALQKLRATNPQATPADLENQEYKKVLEASIAGDRKTLVADSAIPATMAVIYLLLALYFKSIGGYKPVHLAGTAADGLSDKDESIPAKPKK